MSTNSCVIIKVRREDVGKKAKFNEKVLSVTLNEWVDKDSNGRVYSNQIGKDKTSPVEIKDQYIGIYCHWDGYPENVGEALKEKFTDYDSVLNLILGGDCSYIESNRMRHYANRMGEKWEYLKPKQSNTQTGVMRRYPSIQYAYLFDEERGGWLYKPVRFSKNAYKEGFKKF